MARPEPGATADPDPEPDGTKYCQECGSEITAKAEICPDCGVRQADQDSSSGQPERAKKYLIAGIVLGVLAILFLPIIWGPLAMISGLLAMYYGRPLAGAGVVAWGVIATIIGWILGIIGLMML